MRNVVFRFLSGLLAIGFACFLLSADRPGIPMRELIVFTSVAIAFGLFALVGPGPAERLLAFLFGIETPRRPNDSQQERTSAEN